MHAYIFHELSKLTVKFIVTYASESVQTTSLKQRHCT